MAEYIDRDKAFEAVDNRVNELKGDKEFNLPKEICVRGVMKHLAAIPVADVIERVKIDKAIEEIESEYINLGYAENRNKGASYGIRKSLEILKKHIGE